MIPTRTPNDIVTLLHREIVGIIALPDVTERLLALGFDPVASTPEEFAKRIAVEIEMSAKVIRAGNIKP